MARSKISYMKRIVAANNIDFSFSGFIGNTFDSHHLIWKAREDFRPDLQDRAVQSVFRTYFEEYSSIGGPLATNDFTECVCMGVSSVLRSGTDAGKMVGQNRYGGLL